MTDGITTAAPSVAGLEVTLPSLEEPDNHHVSAEDAYKRLDNR